MAGETTLHRGNEVTMIGAYRNGAALRAAVHEAAKRLERKLDRELRERSLPVPFMRGGRVFKRTARGVVSIGS